MRPPTATESYTHIFTTKKFFCSLTKLFQTLNKSDIDDDDDTTLSMSDNSEDDMMLGSDSF